MASMYRIFGLFKTFQKPLFTEINGSKKTEEQIYTRTTKKQVTSL